MRHTTITIETHGRGLIDVTARVREAVTAAGVSDGLCHVFIHHTSASLLIGENADPDVLADLEAFFGRLVRDGDPLFRHDAEGPDDMPAHVRSVLTATSVSVPLAGGRLLLGTWQAIYLWEHRHRPHTRRLTISLVD